MNFSLLIRYESEFGREVRKTEVVNLQVNP